MWTDVIGQERATDTLVRAAERPTHAYLLVGPRGSGIEAAARTFAALLIGAADDERTRRLVAARRASRRRRVRAGWRVVQGRRRPREGPPRSAPEPRSRVTARCSCCSKRRDCAVNQNGRRRERDAEDARGAARPHGRRARDRRAPTTCCRRSVRAASASTSIRCRTTRCGPRSSAKACPPRPPRARGVALGRSARARPRAGRPARRPARVVRPRPRPRSTAPARPRSRSRKSSMPRSSGAADAVARRHAEELAEFDAEMERLGYTTATHNACGAGSTSATSASCAGRASISCSKASPRSRPSTAT